MNKKKSPTVLSTPENCISARELESLIANIVSPGHGNMAVLLGDYGVLEAVQSAELEWVLPNGTTWEGPDSEAPKEARMALVLYTDEEI